MANASRTITITFADGQGGNTAPRDVLLTVKNWCTDQVIAGASVTLTVNSVADTQVSNGSGEVTFLQVPPGTHSLLITASGYLDSTADTLANDSITV